MPFPPDRTLFVSDFWPFIGLHEFTTITAALAQASIMTPTQANPVAIVIYPGTYTENIDLQSWVFLSSASTHQNAVTINGTVTWTLPATSNTFEVVQLYFLNIRGLTTVTTTDKPDGPDPPTPGHEQDGQTSFILHGCFLTGGLKVNGRSATVNKQRDFVFAVTCACRGRAPFTIDSCLFEWVAGRVTGMTFDTPPGKGDCLFRIIGSTTTLPNATPWSVKGKATGTCTGSNFTTEWKLNDQASVVFAGCSLSTLTVAAGATADIRSSECPDVSRSGPGAVNRRSLTMPYGPTVTNNNVVTFDVPFPDAAYNVSLQLTNMGTLNHPPLVINKAPANFIIQEQSGGHDNTYDITVIHD